MDKKLTLRAAINTWMLAFLFLSQGMNAITTGHEIWGAVSFLACFFTCKEAFTFYELYKETK